MTNSTMTLDDADTVQRFIAQMKVQPQHSNLTDIHDHPTSPEPHPTASPHISGLRAPYNTPKTAASSPRLTATEIHNQNVADAFYDYVNAMEGRPLSESIWAPANARHKPSMPHGARSARVLTPIKAVQPNPDTNETFTRMTFKAADPIDTVGKNLIGDRITQAIFPKAPPSFGFDTPADTDLVKKENEAPATSKAYLPPHLRTTRDSNPMSDSIPRALAQDTIKFSSSEPSKMKASSDQNLASSNLEGFSPEVTSKVSKPSPIKNTVRDTITDVKASNEVKAPVTAGSTGAKPSTDPSSVSEDLEHKTIFRSWPKQEERSRPAAKVRKVIIKDLPRGSTATFVASLVYGGSIEEIHIRSSAAGDLSAVIRFMDAGECMKFYEETSNGLVYEKDAKGRELVLFVELSKDVDVVGGLLQGWIASGVTRCVRAVGVEADWGMDGLLKIAERKNRKVEKIVDGQNPGGARSVVFRFCKVEDAVQFKAAISRDEAWEHCNIHYAADPCATATGVHFEG